MFRVLSRWSLFSEWWIRLFDSSLGDNGGWAGKAKFRAEMLDRRA